VRAPPRVRAIDGDAAVVPPLHATAGVALEQQPVRLHDPIDAFDVDRRSALLPATPPDQRVYPAIAVGRLAGDGLFDLGQQLGFRLRRTPAPAARCSSTCLRDQVGAC